jgi:fatty-acyl-CoA synthase
VWATSCAEWPILQFGCALAGVVVVNVNPANRSHELSFVLRKSRMRALFLHTLDKRSNYKSILEESRAGQTLALEHVIYLDSGQWEDFLCEPDGITVNPDPDEPANIQYTSGTTGQFKGVLLTHVNLVNNARFFADYMRLTEQGPRVRSRAYISLLWVRYRHDDRRCFRRSLRLPRCHFRSARYA